MLLDPAENGTALLDTWLKSPNVAISMRSMQMVPRARSVSALLAGRPTSAASLGNGEDASVGPLGDVVVYFFQIGADK